ncbi:uracil-DNA glycosylase [Nitrosophilus kaiyonis]|uniref:uracil-DNA glycosylase n=1 Tax=Nitrosophilus kaiyonis TaxID=2930200 RepID=UPI002490B907|nr:uracil-DNA glycosylase [Nitrosophilus kaiyonis]
MDKIKKAKLLKNLYYQKWIGYQYIDPINIENNHKNISLPNSLEKLKEIVKNCHLCDLSKTRKNVVFGEGNPHAKLMFIGEGPGATEDEMGRPFVGRAGQLLTKMIENVLEIKREDVYIANIVKCRPPNNRVPTEEEAKTCMPYLIKQIEIINPKILVALGSTSYRYLTNDTTPISKIRGEIVKYKDKILIPTYHPSFLLRNPSKKKEAYLDLLKIKSLL